MKNFHKAYTRDTGLVEQDCWSNAFSEGFRDISGKNNPVLPPNIYYINDGTAEIWDCKESLQWFMDVLLEKNKKDPGFFQASVRKYKQLLGELEKYKKKTVLSSIDELKRFVSFMRLASSHFVIFYYTSLDDRTPKAIRKKALAMRAVDRFFDDCDKIVKNTLQKLFPWMKGMELVITPYDFDSIPTKEELEQRMKHSVFTFGKKPEIIDLDTYLKKHNDYKFFFDEITEETLKDGIIIGQTAFKGKASGRVRILRRKSQISELKQGEILVTFMTTPDFLPAIKKAAAIVTDEGGITCHAAIISRELKIPCVIGTKIATQFLKDGDFVEVDAEKGVVKRIDSGNNTESNVKSDIRLGVVPETDDGLNFKIMRRRPTKGMSPIIWNVLSESSAHCKKYHGTCLKRYYALFDEGTTAGSITGFYDLDDWSSVSSFVCQRIIDDKDYLGSIYKLQRKQGASIIRFYDELRKVDLTRKSPTDLIEIYSRIMNAWLDFDVINVYPWLLGGDLFAEYLKKELVEKHLLAEEEAVKMMTSPEISFSIDEEKEFLMILAKVKKIKLDSLFKAQDEEIIAKLPSEIKKAIAKISNRYHWIPFGYEGPELYDAAHYIKQLRESLHKPISEINKRIDDINNYAQKLIAEQEKIIKKHNITKETMRLLDDLYCLALLTDERKIYQSRLHIIFNKLILEICSRTGLTKQEAKDIIFDELKENINHPGKLKSIAAERVGKPVIIFNDSITGLEFVKGKKQQEIMDKLTNVEMKDSLKGTVACKGKGLVAGPARIMNSVSEMKKMRQGDVLLSHMTTPEFVPAMRKAAAIVTDDGGVTCHAAIVSRELNIPCIIGTENATKVFKDNDRIEVDTEKGVVRKIKPSDANSSLSSSAISGHDYRSLFKSTEWHKIGLWDTPFFEDYNNVICTPDLKKIEYPGGYECFLYLDGEVFMGEKDFVNSYDYHKQEFEKKGLAYFEWLGKNITKFHDESIDFSLKIANMRADSIEKLSNAEIKSLLSQLLDRIDKNISMAYVLQPLDEFLSELLEKSLKHYLNSSSAKEQIKIMSLLTSPIRRSAMINEHHELLSIAASIDNIPGLKKSFLNSSTERILLELRKNYKNIYNRLLAHQNDYGWMSNFNWNDHPTELGTYVINIAEMLKGNPASEMHKIDEDERAAEKECSELLKKINSSDAKAMSKHIREFVNLKMENWEAVSISGNNCREFMIQAAKRIGLSLDEFFLLSKDEVFGLLDGKLSIRDVDLQKPKRGIIRIKDKITILSRQEVKEFRDILQSRVKEQEIKGLVVYLGKATGTVRKIMSAKEISKMKQGDVLVCPMSNPDYVPAIKKASAIVADDGGLLCHAAIVSREFKIPCIVGTKIATAALNDDDLIEVDAEEGIVRKVGAGKENTSVASVDAREFVIMRDRDCMLTPCYWNSLLQTSLDVKKIFSFTLSSEYNTYIKGRMQSIMYKDEWDFVGDKISARMLDDKKYFVSLKQKTADAKKRIRSFLAMIGKKDIASMSFKGLLADALQIRDLFMEYDRASVPAWFFAGDHAKRKIIDRLKISGDELEIISMPKQPSFAARVELEALKESLSSKPSDALAEMFYKKYYKLSFGYDGPASWSKDYFLRMISEARADISVTKKKITGMKERQKKSISEADELMSHKHLQSKEAKHYADVMHHLIMWTDERKELEYPLFYYYSELMRAIGSMHGLSEKQMKYLFTEEIAGLETSNDKLRKIADERISNDFATFTEKGITRIIDDKEYSELIKKINAQNVNQSIIKGIVACQGPEKKYMGTARILFSARDNGKIKKGEFLVATMTIPDFMPAMSIAKGFITDEGGVTCHAAIIAREMNKPCIIGTCNATKILKDGDIIEIDTTIGTVKKIDDNKTCSDEKNIPDSAIKKTVLADYDSFAKHYNENEWVKVGSWKLPYLTYDLFNNSQSTYYMKKYEFDILVPIKYLSVGCEVFVAKKELDEMKKRVSSVLKAGKYSQMIAFIEKQDEFCKELRKLTDKIIVNGLKDEYIAPVFDLIWTVLSVFEFNRNMSSYFEEAIASRFAEIRKPALPLPELLEENTVSDSFKLHLALVNIKKRMRVDSITKQDLNLSLKRLCDNYAYMNTYILSGRGYDIEDFKKQLETLNINNDSKYKKPVLGDNYLAKLVALMNKLSAQRLLNIESVNRAIYYLQPYIDKAIKKIGFSEKSLYEIPVDKLYLLLSNEKLDEKNNEFKNEKIAFYSWDKTYMIKGKDFERFKKEFFSKEIEHEKITEIRGTPTFHGIVKGKVNIVLEGEFEKFKDGDVLVCSMTDPSYVSLMKRASAVITDMGGILCHAAIISRELKKPCIIGTKIATKVLKDGDIIEVDANNGVIRKLGGDYMKENNNLDFIEPEKGEKWELMARDMHSPYLRNSIWISSLYIWKEFNLPVPYLGIISRNNDIEYIGLLSCWQKIGKIFFSRIKNDIDEFERIINLNISFGEKLNEFTQEIFDSDLNRCSSKQLIDYYKEFAKMQSREYAYGILLPLTDIGGISFIDGYLKDFLKKKISEKDYHDYYSVFTYPEHDSFSEDQENGLLKIYSSIFKDKKLLRLISDKSSPQCVSLLKKSYPEIYSKLANHTKKYAWIYYVFEGPAYAEYNFIDLIKDYIIREISPDCELAAKKDKRIRIEKKKKKYLESLKPDDFSRRMILFAGRLVWAKPRRKDYQSKSYYHIEKLMSEIARRLNISLDEARATPITMLEQAFDNNKIDKSLLSKIIEKHAYIITKHGTKFLVGNAVEKFIRENIAQEYNESKSDVSELKGNCACQGAVVRGTVKIINKSEEMAKMAYGDILISIATTPAVVPAMKKAAAIITDEGGLTCHAAIVSREINKPCIIGTKIATKVLKDGDIVEVDANNGVVKIMRKNEKKLEISIVNEKASKKAAKKTAKTVKKIDKKVNPLVTELKGTIINPGVVVGKAKIVKSASDTAKVKTGDVFIAAMTNPKFRKAMEKSIAIITDQGDATCHAADVSREMSKPCIISTVIATKTFKDNDYLEVDAGKGIVRKITADEFKKKLKSLKKQASTIGVSKIPESASEVEIRPDLIAWFKDLSKKDLPLVGGKGANLGEMFNHFPIPNGFCITVNAYKKFLQDNKIEESIFSLLRKLDIENTKLLDEASVKIEKLIMNAKMPSNIEEEIIRDYRNLGSGFVAVRSSATAEDLPTASFAGQQATFLNVKGEKDILVAVKQCWASLFTARAIYYRVINQFHHEKVLISVVVQQMVDSEKAGVMFTANPVNNNRDEMIIEGSFGLGESVVSGQVTPDTYIMEKSPLKMQSKAINEKKMAIVKDEKTGKNHEIKLDSARANTQCLSDQEIIDLAKVGILIEEHYGRPQDIEWAVDKKGKVYILQSRPITTLG